jgi:hypothetical protein
MYDVIGIVVFMAIVVGLAAAILFALDRITLRSGVSKEDRRIVVEKRTARWQRRWAFFYAWCAAVALVVNALNLEHQPLRRRIAWSVLPALVILWFLLSPEKDGGGIHEGEDKKEAKHTRRR